LTFLGWNGYTYEGKSCEGETKMKRRVVLAAVYLAALVLTGCKLGTDEVVAIFWNRSSFTITITPNAGSSGSGLVFEGFTLSPGEDKPITASGDDIERYGRTLISWRYSPSDKVERNENPFGNWIEYVDKTD
jgi:hypothetical protein